MEANGTSTSWDEVIGSKKWSGLIEPELNLSLRQFILRCGDFCQATYDAFNFTAESPNCGNSNYGKDTFFHDVLLKDASRYRIVSFIYATAGINSIFDKSFFFHPKINVPWDKESNWFGYVAITTDKESRAIGRREVYVAWRGTIMTAEWASNIFGATPVPASPFFNPNSSAKNSGTSGGFLIFGKEPRIHEGWYKIYTSKNDLSPYVKSSPREQLHHAIEAIKNKYKDEKLSIIVTGHSLGGSLATLSAFDLAENNVAGGDEVPISVVAFGCPQVGNDAFKDRALSIPKLSILQVNNIRDAVPRLPDSLLSLYVPVATEELEIDTKKSPYLFSKLPSEVLPDFHNLQANLHVVAGWNGSSRPFELKVKRSLALVNKSCRYLKSEYHIPELWWTERNKGMEYDEANDEWIFDPPPPVEKMINLSL